MDHSTGTAIAYDEQALLAALRQGHEEAFEQLIARFHGSLLRLAHVYVNDRTVAEEVVQETWLGLLQGLARFEERSSLKTWLFRILTNRAKTRGQRESRTVAFSELLPADGEDDSAAVDASRFSSDPRAVGHWSSAPQPWDIAPDERAIASETRVVIDTAIAKLPANQQMVIKLRDIEGWSATETCNELDITETHQRVLLHRARSRVRQALEEYYGGGRR